MHHTLGRKLQPGWCRPLSPVCSSRRHREFAGPQMSEVTQLQSKERKRMQETAQVLRDLGAVVDERIYRGMGHTVNRDEIEAVRLILAP